MQACLLIKPKNRAYVLNLYLPLILTLLVIIIIMGVAGYLAGKMMAAPVDALSRQLESIASNDMLSGKNQIVNDEYSIKEITLIRDKIIAAYNEYIHNRTETGRKMQ